MIINDTVGTINITVEKTYVSITDTTATNQTVRIPVHYWNTIKNKIDQMGKIILQYENENEENKNLPY
jgi:hypothetical protein